MDSRCDHSLLESTVNFTAFSPLHRAQLDSWYSDSPGGGSPATGYSDEKYSPQRDSPHRGSPYRNSPGREEQPTAESSSKKEKSRYSILSSFFLLHSLMSTLLHTLKVYLEDDTEV